MAAGVLQGILSLQANGAPLRALLRGVLQVGGRFATGAEAAVSREGQPLRSLYRSVAEIEGAERCKVMALDRIPNM